MTRATWTATMPHVRLACPSCRSLLLAPAEHSILVDCPCGAELSVRRNVAGYSLRERIVTDDDINLAMETWR